MTWFLDVRTEGVGGSVAPVARLRRGVGLGPGAPKLEPPVNGLPAEFAAGRRVLLLVHGFNVSRPKAVVTYAKLEEALKLNGLPDDYLVIGVLWPGDYWIPVINYPAEAADAKRSGQRIADFIKVHFGRMGPVSFLSTSLGARVVLEAVAQMRPMKADRVCLTAAAVDDNCLAVQYDAARANAVQTTVLASRKDRVLRLAYPVGDFVSDIFYDNDSPFRSALGRAGPRPTVPALVSAAQIADEQEYDHGDYFPPSSSDINRRSGQTAAFATSALAGQAHGWPFTRRIPR